MRTPRQSRIGFRVSGIARFVFPRSRRCTSRTSLCFRSRRATGGRQPNEREVRRGTRCTATSDTRGKWASAAVRADVPRDSSCSRGVNGRSPGSFRVTFAARGDKHRSGQRSLALSSLPTTTTLSLSLSRFDRGSRDGSSGGAAARARLLTPRRPTDRARLRVGLFSPSASVAPVEWTLVVVTTALSAARCAHRSTREGSGRPSPRTKRRRD